MNIEKEIINILSTHGKVVLTGFGSFIADNEAAKIHPVNNDFNPPSKTIFFKIDETETDNLLANHLSALNNVSKAEILNIIANFISEIKRNLEVSGKHVFENFGVLYLNQSGEYIFELNSGLNLSSEAFGMEGFNSPAIKREKVEPPKIVVKKKRSKVWVILLILFILIVGGSVGTYFIFPEQANKCIYFVENQYNTIKDKFSKKETSTSNIEQKDKLVKDKRKVKKNNKKNIIGEALNQLTDTLSKAMSKDTAKLVSNIKPEVKEKPVTINGKMYYIVAGSFKSKENADKYVSELKSKSYPNAILLDNPKKGFFTVAYDRFSDKASADRKLKEINSTGNSGSWIICE